LAVILTIYSCRPSTEETVSKGTEYFPIKIGDIHYYQIDTLVYDLFKKEIDTFSSLVKEEVIEKFQDATDDTVYRVELSRFSESSSNWEVFRTFERKIVDNYAIEKLDNISELKMIFPISSYKTKGSSYTWNINMFNNSDPLSVKYTSIFTSFYNGINPYNNCVSIKLNKPTIGRVNINRTEVYAKNIGLVYRFIENTNSLDDSSFLNGSVTTVRLKN
jgi:hypothetical protein